MLSPIFKVSFNKKFWIITEWYFVSYNYFKFKIILTDLRSELSSSGKKRKKGNVIFVNSDK